MSSPKKIGVLCIAVMMIDIPRNVTTVSDLFVYIIQKGHKKCIIREYYIKNELSPPFVLDLSYYIC